MPNDEAPPPPEAAGTALACSFCGTTQSPFVIRGPAAICHECIRDLAEYYNLKPRSERKGGGIVSEQQQAQPPARAAADLRELTQLSAQLRDTADFLRRCRGTEPASHFEAHAIECDRAAAALSHAEQAQARLEERLRSLEAVAFDKQREAELEQAERACATLREELEKWARRADRGYDPEEPDSTYDFWRGVRAVTDAALARVPATPELLPALEFRCVDAVHVFASPDKKGRCACGKWLIAVSERVPAAEQEQP